MFFFKCTLLRRGLAALQNREISDPLSLPKDATVQQNLLKSFEITTVYNRPRHAEKEI